MEGSRGIDADAHGFRSHGPHALRHARIPGLIPAALAALGWTERPGGDDPAALGRFVERWLAAVPFENLSRLRAAAGGSDLRRSSDRRPPGRPRAARVFWRDHLDHGAGGTCFDIAAAARRILRGLGWSVDILFAWPPDEASRPHVVLKVATSAGPRLVDLGYALPVPLPLDPAVTTRVAHPWYDLELVPGPEPDEFLVFTGDSRGRRFRYRLVDRPVEAAAWRAAWRAVGACGARYMRRIALGRGTRDARLVYHPSGRIVRLSRDRQEEAPIDGAEALAAAFDLPERFVREGLAALARLERLGAQ